MGSKTPKPVTAKTGGPYDAVRRTPDGKVDTLSTENHIQLASRLARVTHMHGTPSKRAKNG